MTLDRVKAGLLEIIEHAIGRRLLYAYLWEATVVSFSGGRAELVIDDPRMKGTGASQITLRNGAPGIESTLRQGDRVVVGFSGGDPDKPFIVAHGEATDGTQERVARETDPVDIGRWSCVVVAGAITTIKVIQPGNMVPTTIPVEPSPPVALGAAIEGGSDRAKLED